jgi:predicted short-subunit dehydrogenase-like oxidoreductase (DUF2520 family)
MISNNLPSIYIIGGGRTGASLAAYFLHLGLKVNAVVERNTYRLNFLKRELKWNFVVPRISPSSLNVSRFILLTTQDKFIANVAAELSRLEIDWKNKIVLHCSGTLPSEILESLRRLGARVAAIHPIYSFSEDPRSNYNLNEIWFDGEGDQEAIASIKSLVTPEKNPRFLEVTPAQKIALHLATVFYSNFYVAIAQMSCELLAGMDLSDKDAFTMLDPLLSASHQQVLENGLSQALTGPLKRGDEITIVTHLNYLRSNHPEYLEIYIQLSRKLLAISGLSGKDQVRLEGILQQFQQ